MILGIIHICITNNVELFKCKSQTTEGKLCMLTSNTNSFN